MSESDRIPVDRGTTVYRRGRQYWVDFHQDGKRTRRKLGTSDKRRALILARELASEIACKLWNIAAASELTIDTAFEKYRASTQWTNLAKHTKENDVRTLAALKKWLVERKLLQLDRVQRSHMDQFCKWKAAQPHPKTKKPISPVTVNQWFSRLSAFFNWLLHQGFIRFNPASRIRLKTKPAQAKPVLSPEQVVTLIDACPPTLRDLCITISETALRIGEAVNLKGGDVDAEAKTLRVFNSKANRFDFIPLNASALAVLLPRKLATGTDGFIFTCSNGSQIDRRNVRRDLILIGEKVGIKVSGPHMLRRSCLTNAANTLTSWQLSQLGRHRDPRTTARYYVSKLNFVPPTMVRRKEELNRGTRGPEAKTEQSP